MLSTEYYCTPTKRKSEKHEDRTNQRRETVNIRKIDIKEEREREGKSLVQEKRERGMEQDVETAWTNERA